MDIYFDKANFESYIQTCRSNSPLYDKYNAMLKEHLDVFLNMTKAEFMSSEWCASWLKAEWSHGRDKNHKLKFNEDAPYPRHPMRLKKTSGHLYARGEKHSHVYCLDRGNIQTLNAKGNYLIGGVGNEIQLIDSLLFDGKDYFKSLPPTQHFNTLAPWSALDKYPLPCTDIIIGDLYALNFENSYSYNILSLIEKLSQKLSKAHVNIVLIGLEKFSFVQNGTTAIYTPNWDKLRSLIKSKLISKQVTANVSFVALGNDKAFHDRHIFTNYRFYTSGASLTFYDGKGNFASRGDSFFMQSLATKEQFDEAFGFVHRMQEIINHIPKGQLLLEPKPISSYSNYLTFK